MQNFATLTLKIAVAFTSTAIFLFQPSTALAKGRFVVASGERKPGKTALPSFSRVLSFDELMRLPRAKRVSYLRGLRKMMVQIEKLPPKLRASTMGPEYSKIAALLALLEGDQAFAAGDVPTVTSRGNIVCAEGFTHIRASPMLSGVTVADSDTQNFVCVIGKDAKPQSTSCPANSIPVRQSPDGDFYCASMASYKALHPLMQERTRTVNHFKVFMDGGVNEKFNSTFPTGEQLKARRLSSMPKPAPVVAPVAAPVTAPAPVRSAESVEAARKAALARGGVAPKVPVVAPVVSAPATGRAGDRVRSGNAEVGTGTTSPASVAPAAPVAAAPVAAPAPDQITITEPTAAAAITNSWAWATRAAASISAPLAPGRP